MILKVAVAMVATLALSILFGAPRCHWLFCAIAGGIGWLLHALLSGAGTSLVLASFVAALALTGVARLFSLWRKAPVIMFLIPGIFPLVPGAGLYYTAYYLFSDTFMLAASTGVETLKLAGAIALGILLASSLPTAFFRWPLTLRDTWKRRKSTLAAPK